MKTRKLKSYSDPGHGWLAVPLKFFTKIDSVVSPWSYINKNRTTVFLEEDMDAGKFITAAKEKGYEIKMIHNISNKQSKIRSMRKFSNRYEEKSC